MYRSIARRPQLVRHASASRHWRGDSLRLSDDILLPRTDGISPAALGAAPRLRRCNADGSAAALSTGLENSRWAWPVFRAIRTTLECKAVAYRSFQGS